MATRPAAATRAEPRRFSRPVLDALERAKIIGVRAGARSTHRFVGVWVVVVDGRVFARSWSLTRAGWYESFLADPLGAITVGDRELRVRARRARGERIRDAVERAYAEKYSTPGAQVYVRGFRTARRRDATMEFLPR